MKLLSLLLFLSFIFSGLQTKGQIKFNKTFGGTCEVEGTFVQACNDSGYVIASNNCYGAYIIRTNSFGDTLWTSSFTDTIQSPFTYLSIPKITCIKETSDHGFIMTGTLDPNGYCRKIDSVGNKLWSNDQPFPFPQNGTLFGNILIQDTGGYIISGYSDDAGPGNFAFYFGITDAGDTTYTYSYSTGGGTIHDFKETDDNGIILVKVFQSSNLYFLEKHGGTSGSWSKSINYMPFCILPIGDSGYISGATWSAQPSLFRSGLVRTDSLGDSLWSKELGFIPIDIVPVNLPGDSGYVMIVNYYQPTQSFDNLNPFCEVQNSDIRLVRTDLDGNIIWEKKFGGSILDIASNLIVTNDSGYCIVGSSRSESGKSEIIFIKTDSLGNDH